MKPFRPTLLLLATMLLGIVPANSAVDLDADGLNDVWEQFFHAAALTAGGDDDGDGRTNVQESSEGTDPLLPASKFELTSIAMTETQAQINWLSVAGKSYCLQVSSDLMAWAPDGLNFIGTGSEMSAQSNTPSGESARFFRVCVLERDSDADGLTDWEEITAQLDPNSPQTNPGLPDLIALTAALGATTSTVSLEVVEGQAYEADTASNAPKAGQLRLRRTGALTALSVHYALSGRPQQGIDYVEVFPGTAALPFGGTRLELFVTPVADAQVEVPETLLLTLTPSPDYSVGTASGGVRIEDFETQNESLFFAPLTAQSGVTTNASGYATIFLSGDHTSFRTSASFSNLSSLQKEMDGAHLHYVPTKEIVHELPSGQIVNDFFALPENGTGTLTSDQAILDALTGNNLYLNIHTDDLPNGEIRGDFRAVSGSITFTPPADPPAVPSYTGLEQDKDVERFLAQATFGQTDALFTEVKTKGVSAWLDEQMNPLVTPMSSLYSFAKAADNWNVDQFVTSINADGQITSAEQSLISNYEPRFSNLIRGWWQNSTYGRDQLRQRVAFALSEIMVVSTGNSKIRNAHYGMADYYDVLARNAFGSFRTLIEEVSTHPVMATYLSMIRNEPYNPTTGVSPDENYARELMQLFTIGLVQLHPDGSLKLDPTTGQPQATYNNTHITELAKVFTGWSFAVRQAGGNPQAMNPNTGAKTWDNNGTITTNNNFYAAATGAPYAQAGYSTRLKMFTDRHDTSAKAIVTRETNPISNGNNGEADLDDALDALVNHPSTPAFVARRLIQRLVTGNPSAGYIYRVGRVFENDGTGTRGNLGAVVRAILTDYEARSQELAGQVGFGKLREPLVRMTNFFRATNTGSSIDSSALAPWGFAPAFPAGTPLLLISNTNDTIGQSPLGAPSVFNWFHPDYTFPGGIQDAGLFAPEFEITTETQVVNFANYLNAIFWNGDGNTNNNGLRGDNVYGYSAAQLRNQPNLSTATAVLTASGVSALIEYLNGLFCHGAMRQETKDAITTALNATTSNGTTTATTEKVRVAIYLVLSSPDYSVQR